jgi:transitional endoplasmic reticulum ATPase
MAEDQGTPRFKFEGLESLIQEVQQLLSIEQLVNLADKLDQGSDNPTQNRVQVSTQINRRSLSNIPRRGNIPYPPRPEADQSDQSQFIVTPPPSSNSTQPSQDLPQIAQLVGGLESVLAQLRDLVEIPLKRPDILEKLGLEPPKGVLLVGAPGTGKTLTARSLAQTLGVNYLAVVAPELIGKYYGEAEARLRQLFEQAAKSAPCLIFIDEIDALVPNRAKVEGEVEKRLVAQLLGLMDGFATTKGVIVLAATNRAEAIDPALRRPGRFDREIYFPVPNPEGRREILAIHTAAMPLADDLDLAAIAGRAYGFVGADLKGLCQSAAFHALKLQVTDLTQVPENLQVSQADFEWALQEVKPAVLRSLVIQSPQVLWAEIGGLESAKQNLQEAIAGVMVNPELYSHTRAQSAKGILLCGAPGTGKTLLAKAVATEAKANFIAVNGAELLSKWVGESELAIRQLFTQARQASPCVIFIDEIDTLAPARGSYGGDQGVSDRVIGQLLTEIDGIRANQNLIVIAATNRRESIDPALIRSGRIELHIQIDLPDRSSRSAILAVHNRDRPLANDLNLEIWADRTNGFSGADLAFLSNRAAIFAIRRYQINADTAIADLRINQADFEQAIDEMQQSAP